MMTEFYESEAAWQLVHHALRCEGETSLVKGMPREWATKANLSLLNNSYVDKYVVPVLQTVDAAAVEWVNGLSLHGTKKEELIVSVNDRKATPPEEIETVLDAIQSFSIGADVLGWLNQFDATEDQALMQGLTIVSNLSSLSSRFYTLSGADHIPVFPFEVMEPIVSESATAASDVVAILDSLCDLESAQGITSILNTLSQNWSSPGLVSRTLNRAVAPFFDLISNTRSLHDF
jgi:hypothetical protein